MMRTCGVASMKLTTVRSTCDGLRRLQGVRREFLDERFERFSPHRLRLHSKQQRGEQAQILERRLPFPVSTASRRALADSTAPGPRSPAPPQRAVSQCLVGQTTSAPANARAGNTEGYREDRFARELIRRSAQASLVLPGRTPPSWRGCPAGRRLHAGRAISQIAEDRACRSRTTSMRRASTTNGSASGFTHSSSSRGKQLEQLLPVKQIEVRAYVMRLASSRSPAGPVPCCRGSMCPQ